MKKSSAIVIATLLLLTSHFVYAQNASVQFIHNSADIDVRSIDVYANGDSLLGTFAFRTATAFMELASGAYTIVLAPDNSANAEDSVIVQVDLQFDAGGKYVVIINGIYQVNLDAGKYTNPDPTNRVIALTVFNIANAQDAAADPAKVDIMAFHGSTDATALDVVVGGLPIINDLDYGQNTAYTPLDPFQYQFDITPADDNTNVLAMFDVDISTLAGNAVVVFASGFLTPADDEGGKALGLFGALPTGDVVEFPEIIILPAGPWENMELCSEWQYDSVFEDTTTNQTHGVAVDKFGNVWSGSYGAKGIVVRDPDGTEASFSPIDEVTVNGEVIDIAAGNCRGMATDHEGNILYCKGADLIKINSETGEGMAKWTGPGSLLAPSVDDEGYIYVGKVVGVGPINVIDPATFELVQEIELPGAASYARGAVVTPDGMGIWAGDLGGSGGPLYNWTSTDLVTYTKSDSIYTNTDAEMIFTTQRTTIDWGPNGTMWVSHDNAYAGDDNSPNGFFVFNFCTMKYCFLPSPPVVAGVGNGPRGVAFSASGDTAYSCSFNAHKVWRFVRKPRTMVQFIHNAADIDVRTIDVYANGDSLLGSFGFRTATPFMEMAPGTYTIVLAPDNSANAEDSVIVQADLTLEQGKKHAVIINGLYKVNLDAGKYTNPDPINRVIELTLFNIPDARLQANNPAKVDVMAFHGSTDAPALDVVVGILPLINDLDYGQNTPYYPLDPAEYQFDLTPADDNTTVLAMFEVDISNLACKAAIVFTSGFLTPADDEGGKALGLFAALPDGSVIEFPQIIVLPAGPWKNMGTCSDWQYDSVFEDTTTNQNHGIAVDKFGNVWSGSYGAKGIVVRNPDGNEVDFSPIDEVTVNGEVIDIAAGNCRGMATDHEGNILYCKGADLIKINSETGEGMAKWAGPGSLLAPSVDDEGFIYVGKVVGVGPINVIDPATFELVQEIELPGSASYARGAVVTPDGTGIWAGDLGGSGGPLYNWTSTDLVTYTKTDSIYTNTDAEMIFTTQRTTIDWGPMGTMWVSHDNAYAGDDNTPNGLFVFDFNKMEYCFLPSPQVISGVGNGPRGVAFSASGDTAYTISFNAGKVWRFVRTGTGVETLGSELPIEYALSQNYPNPFNPSTTIHFSIAKKGYTTLTVYDMLGREVATLVNKNLTVGRYTVHFDATRLSSGTYIYKLKSGKRVMTKKLTLMK